MKKSTNTYLPSLGKYSINVFSLCSFIIVLVVCPSFSFGFNIPFLESINNTEDNFKKGNWIGNYSINLLDPEFQMIYKNATFNVEKGKHFTQIMGFIYNICIIIADFYLSDSYHQHQVCHRGQAGVQ